MRDKIKDFTVFTLILLSFFLLSASNFEAEYDFSIKLMIQSVILFTLIMVWMLIDLNKRRINCGREAESDKNHGRRRRVDKG